MLKSEAGVKADASNGKLSFPPTSIDSHSRSIPHDLEEDSKRRERVRKQRPSKRKRSKSPPKFSGGADIAQLHPNKALIQAILDVTFPECSDPNAQKMLDNYQKFFLHTIKQHFESKTGWDQLCQEWAAIEPLDCGTQNTNYRNTRVDLEDLRPWKDFPTYEEIYEFSKSTPLLEKNFHKELPVIASDKRCYHRLFADSSLAPEVNIVELMAPFFQQLNALIRLATYERGKKTPWIIIGGGKAAMKRREGGTHNKKDPERAAFWTDGNYILASPTERGIPRPPIEIPCLLVGDYKMVGKFYHEMLVQACAKQSRVEAQKVMNQIHDYMDMHHNRFGYIITETEVIMFRRREEQEMWGQIDFSPAIPLQAKEGNLNALMVLWYFHVKYAALRQDETYELPSFYHNCPADLRGESSLRLK